MGKHVLHCLALLTLSAIAGIAAARPPAAPVPDSGGPILLGPYFEILIDRDAKLGLEDVVGAEFKRSFQDVPGFGFTSAALWLRISAEGQVAAAGWWYAFE
jgi:hypothetical protein